MSSGMFCTSHVDTVGLENTTVDTVRMLVLSVHESSLTVMVSRKEKEKKAFS